MNLIRYSHGPGDKLNIIQIASVTSTNSIWIVLGLKPKVRAGFTTDESARYLIERYDLKPGSPRGDADPATWQDVEKELGLK